MRILVFLVLLTMSSATIHRLFRPRKLYKHLVKPLFGFAQGSHDEIDPFEHVEEQHGKKSKHHHKKHKEIVIHHHIPHYHHMGPQYHHMGPQYHHMEPHYNHIEPYYHQYHNIHNHIEPIYHVKPFYPNHQQFQVGHQPLHSGHVHQPFHSDHIHEPLSQGGIYGGTIGFHDELIGQGDEQLYHGPELFSSHGGFQQTEGLNNHLPSIN